MLFCSLFREYADDIIKGQMNLKEGNILAVKYGMVLDMSKCIGCYSCVVSCKMCYGTRPGVDYNAVKKVEWNDYPNARQHYLPTMCMHCEDAPCVKACPTGATTQTPEGVVIMDYETCIGCGACVEACPYGQRHLVTDDETNYEGAVAPYEEESNERLNVVEKCTFCYARVQNGAEPMCASLCPAQCRIFGDVNDPESAISQYIAANHAKKIEGTSIYYVIPEGMDESLLPPSFADAVAAMEQPTQEETTAAPATEAPETSGSEQSAAADPEKKDGLNGGAIAAIVGGAAVVAAGGVMYSKKKNSTEEEKKEGGAN